MKDPAHIAITGASSGIGAALARLYAAPGTALSLTGRSAERLNAVAAECFAKGAVVETALLDINDRDAVASWLLERDDAKPIDVLIANAGISAGTGKAPAETGAQTRLIFSTDVDGVLNTVLPILPRMLARKRGQLALMSSLASLRGLPSAPAYSASKAAVRVWGEGLRGSLRETGIEVSVICPGYVDTPMTQVNRFPMPLLMSAEKAARIVARGLARNQSRIAFPRTLYWLYWFLCSLPPGMTDGLFARLPGKTPITEERF